ncbi:hypothetical protein PIROE2DRAFT_60299 [Piromyces sp. E2]|nr:hypothetical protein PIROE2DRAFT_60299 [Piromyces sp. E2]|eukprot:OUM65003.1 hypothetical protein PIROE2DRAFT_60299 [Piromyces sp. E2]
MTENGFGNTLLLSLCSKSDGQDKIIKYLIDNGADVNKKNKHGDTPLIKAIRTWKNDIVKYLIENGADVNKVDKEGNSPLINAYYSENIPIINYLIEDTDVDIDKENNEEGNTLLLLACQRGKKNLAKYLIDNGADVNKENKITTNTP